MKKTKRYLIFLSILAVIGFVVLFSFSSFYQKSQIYNLKGISKQVRDSVKVAKSRGIAGGTFELPSRALKQLNRCRWIRRNATDLELLKLTEYPDGTIKTIAYEGLLKSQSFDKKKELILKAINDTIYTIYYQSGYSDFDNKITIREYLIENILMIDGPKANFGDGFKINIELTQLEKKEILTEYRNSNKTLHNKGYN